jgi:hypothetical protein
MRKIVGGVADLIGADYSPNAATLNLKHKFDDVSEVKIKVENGFNKRKSNRWKTVFTSPRLTCSGKLF